LTLFAEKSFSHVVKATQPRFMNGGKTRFVEFVFTENPFQNEQG